VTCAHHCGVVPAWKQQAVQQVHHRDDVAGVKVRRCSNHRRSVSGHGHKLRSQAAVPSRNANELALSDTCQRQRYGTSFSSRQSLSRSAMPSTTAAVRIFVMLATQRLSWWRWPPMITPEAASTATHASALTKGVMTLAASGGLVCTYTDNASGTA
jgi:hypothetical protein